jgi:zinc protease
LLFIVVIAAGVTPAASFEEGRVYTHTLPNGLTVLTMERHHAPIVVSQLNYRVGSRNEQRGITGISHVVEHMMFKGTPSFGENISAIIANNGGVFNAFTTTENTSYYEVLPADKLTLALRIEADRMTNCLFDSVQFAQEVEVVKQERRMRVESDASGMLWEELNAVAFKSTPRRDPVIGWPADLGGLTRDQAYAYYRTYYTPRNAILVLVGDFETGTAMRQVERFYGRIPPGPTVVQPTFVEAQQLVKKALWLSHNDITTPHITLGFHIPASGHPDVAALDVATRILCDQRGKDTRLYRRLVREAKVATAAEGAVYLSMDPNLFQIDVRLVPDSSADRAEQMVYGEIKRMQDSLVSERELEKVQRQIRYTYGTAYIKDRDIASRLSNVATRFSETFIDAHYRRQLAVNRDDIRRVMRAYFDPSRVVLAYAQPAGKRRSGPVRSVDRDEVLPPHIVPPENTCMYRAEPASVPAPDGGESSADSMHVSAAEVEAILAPRAVTPLVRTFTLRNGVTVHAVRNTLNALVTVNGVLETGWVMETLEKGKPGLASITSQMLNRGTVSQSAEELAAAMEFIPYTCTIGIGTGAATFSGASLPDDAALMFSAGREMLSAPRWDEKEFALVRQREATAARNRSLPAGNRADQYRRGMLFGVHPLGHSTPTEQSVASITLDDCKALHAKYFHPARLHLIVSSPFSPDSLRILLEGTMGVWTRPADHFAPVELPPVPALAGRHGKVFTERSYTQAEIAIAFPVFNNVPDGDMEAAALLNQVLAGGVLNSRLGIVLRKEKGWVYGLSSSFASPADGMGYWSIDTKSAPGHVKDIIAEAFLQIEKVLKEGITEKELLEAKARTLYGLPFALETPDDVGKAMMQTLRAKKSLAEFDGKAARVKAVTLDDIRRVARTYLTPDRFIVTVVGPLDESEADRLF